MELRQALEQLSALQTKLYAYQCASSSLYLDSVTVAPRDTAQGRGVALGVLAGERHKLMTDPAVGQLLDFLDQHTEELSQLQRRQVEELGRSYRQIQRIPADEYMAYAQLTNQASDVWHKAKENNDFASFQPVLEQLVAFSRKFAGYYDPDKAPYDALLGEYERGVDMAYLDEFFAAVRERLVPVIHAIGEKEQPDDSFLYREYPVEAQRKFSDYLMEVLGLDRAHCAIGETEHPFTLEFNNKDVRITTNYDPHNVASSMYSVIHEGGHAKYELDIRDDVQYTCLSGGVSMGVHESQSRFYENLIGRSRPFIEAIFPRMRDFFPEQLAGVTAEQFYRAVNKAQPSLIRIEADELTYCLHIMIRHELEKAFMNGEITVDEIPALWNRKYQDYLGVAVPDDAQGCLQDVHWTMPAGYFPSYALGSAYGAQILRTMEKDFDVFACAAKGDLLPIRGWLKSHVFSIASVTTPDEWIRAITGESLNPEYFLTYLEEKFSALYALT